MATNASAALGRGEPELRRLFRQADEILLSAIVLGELLYGFGRGSRPVANREELDRFLATPHVHLLPVTRTTADRYARIATDLRQKGRPVPTDDIWIADHALDTGADIVSYDAHFAEVDGLVWLRPGA